MSCNRFKLSMHTLATTCSAAQASRNIAVNDVPTARPRRKGRGEPGDDALVIVIVDTDGLEKIAKPRKKVRSSLEQTNEQTSTDSLLPSPLPPHRAAQAGRQGGQGIPRSRQPLLPDRDTTRGDTENNILASFLTFFTVVLRNARKKSTTVCSFVIVVDHNFLPVFEKAHIPTVDARRSCACYVDTQKYPCLIANNVSESVGRNETKQPFWS